MEEYKVYFKLKKTQDGDYHFETDYNSIKKMVGMWDKDSKFILRFAGWWDWKQKFIIQSLKTLYWDYEWQEIFQKFLMWLDNIKNTSQFWDNTWVFVLYKKTNVVT